MPITSHIDIVDGDYGYWKKDKNGKRFISYGKATYVEEVLENIESGEFYLKLSCPYQGKDRKAMIALGETLDLAAFKTLKGKGFQVTKRSYNAFIDLLEMQQEELEEDKIPPTKVYDHLGWIDVINDDGGVDLCYRLDTLVGAQNGVYIGSYDVVPKGDYEVWKHMVEDDVIGHAVLELVLIAALAAVVNGVIAPVTNGENPVIHLNYGSSKGKSTAGFLGASTAGAPFDGVIIKPDADNNPKEYQSIYQSWGATDNAMITTMAGNRGVVTVINELGKNFSKNMTRLIFDLSEGSDKKRLTSTLNTRISERYTTVFISTGESSLLERCNTKLEGLAVRVMEISKPITDSAEHSNRIKETCREHYGFAARMLAEHIIKNGGVKYLLPLYKAWVQKLRAEMPDSPNKDRFVEKFAALFMTTADVATEALGIKFDKDGIKNFLFEYDREHGDERNTSAKSYDVVVEACRINNNKFYTLPTLCSSEDSTVFVTKNPPSEVWGKITNKSYELDDGRKVIEEIEVYPSIVDKILKDNGFSNKKTCIDLWKADGLIDYEEGKNYRKRKIVSGRKPEHVYVFRIFDDTVGRKDETPVCEDIIDTPFEDIALPKWVVAQAENYEQKEVNENETDIPDAYTA